MNKTVRGKSFSKWVVAISGLIVAAFWGCTHPPAVSIEGGTIPVFTLTGRGIIQSITISGPDLDNAKSGEAGSRYMKPFWQIAPNSEYDMARLRKTGGLVYGKVPDGFRQVFPERDVPPPALPENEVLTFDLRVANSNGVGVRFVIQNNKVVVEGS